MMSNTVIPLGTGEQISGQRPSYCLVSPVRNEAEYILRTLNSVVNQTMLPKTWVIVDDGSTDETPAILAEYAARYPFIVIVQRDDRGRRWVGAGVVHTFNYGWDVAKKAETDYLCKLDMDLELPLGYFEGLVALMEADPRLGTVSGKAYFPGKTNRQKDFHGELIQETIGDDVSLGMTKFWRRTAFDEIGGLIPGVMWDGIDCYMMRMQGWKAYSTDSPELRFIHLRPMGSSDRNILIGRQRHGLGQWFIGSSPIFVVMSAIFRLRFRPVMMGSVAMLWGYAKAALTRKPRYQNKEFRQALRRYQWMMMRMGKTRAFRLTEEQGEARWIERHGPVR
jgi:biofilm PGA synthesis N-glycosyltransferase PgaC